MAQLVIVGVCAGRNSVQLIEIGLRVDSTLNHRVCHLRPGDKNHRPVRMITTGHVSTAPSATPDRRDSCGGRPFSAPRKEPDMYDGDCPITSLADVAAVGNEHAQREIVDRCYCPLLVGVHP